jgi:hypothetical protein
MAETLFQPRRKGRAFWLLLPLLIVLYLLLFPRPGGREVFVRPVWAREVPPDSTELSGAEGPSWYFRAADAFGYADLEGNLYYVGRKLQNLSLSDTGFLNYGSVPDHVVFMDIRGRFQFSIRSHGYPLLDGSGQLLYSINTDMSGLKRIDRDSGIVWSMSFSVPVTTVALAGQECVIGLMDGRFLVVDAGGRITHQQMTEGSRIPVVLGAAVSEDRNRIALVSGIDPQRLSVVQRRGGELTTELAMDLGSDIRREVQLRFGPGDRFLFHEAEDGLGVIDVRRKKTSRIPVPGVLDCLDVGPFFAAAAFRSDEGSRLLIFRPRDSVLFSRSLAEAGTYIRILGRSLVLGLDGVLLRADLVEG